MIMPMESAWKKVAQKNKIKDPGLQKALATFEKLGDDKPKEKIKALDDAKKAAMAMSKDKEIADNAEVAKLLKQVELASEKTKKEVLKKKSAADEEE